jgi:hypothetical protein
MVLSMAPIRIVATEGDETGLGLKAATITPEGAGIDRVRAKLDDWSSLGTLA